MEIVKADKQNNRYAIVYLPVEKIAEAIPYEAYLCEINNYMNKKDGRTHRPSLCVDIFDYESLAIEECKKINHEIELGLIGQGII
jgi:hypothetical protein